MGGATSCSGWRSSLPDTILQASRGGEGGENQVGGAWGRLEDGGFLTFLLVCFRTNQSEEIICKEVKVIFIKSSFIHSLVSCGLAVSILPCTNLQPSWTRGDILEKVKVLSLILNFVDFSLIFCQCLKRA